MLKKFWIKCQFGEYNTEECSGNSKKFQRKCWRKLVKLWKRLGKVQRNFKKHCGKVLEKSENFREILEKTGEIAVRSKESATKVQRNFKNMVEKTEALQKSSGESTEEVQEILEKCWRSLNKTEEVWGNLKNIQKKF